MKSAETKTAKTTRFLRGSRPIAIGAVVLGLTQMAGFCGPSDPGPCNSDRFNCDDGELDAFVQKAECGPIAAPLQVELGRGYDSFGAFDTSGEPPFEYGSQGGQHLTVAYRVRGADLGESERLRVSLQMFQREEVCDDGSADVSNGDSTDGGCELAVGQRVMVRGGKSFPLKPDAAGVIVETGIIIIRDSWVSPNLPFKLLATVEDQCGRRAEGSVIFGDND